MRVMKWSMIALAVSAGTSQFAMASAQDDSKGFIEDSTASILTRTLYFSRDFRNNDSGQSRREETGLGFHGLFSSGYTQGTVGVGVDVIGLMGIKLDSGKGRANTGLFPNGSDGRAQDEYSKGGAAVKFRISNTVLKVGDQYTTAARHLHHQQRNQRPETGSRSLHVDCCSGPNLQGQYLQLRARLKPRPARRQFRGWRLRLDSRVHHQPLLLEGRRLLEEALRQRELDSCA